MVVRENSHLSRCYKYIAYNNRIHSGIKKQCSFLALLFDAGDAKRYRAGQSPAYLAG